MRGIQTRAPHILPRPAQLHAKSHRQRASCSAHESVTVRRGGSGEFIVSTSAPREEMSAAAVCK